MLCPLDRTPLIPNRRDGFEAQSCLQCHGVWISRAALESLARQSPQPASAEPPVPTGASGFVLRRLVCPACPGGQLQTRMQGNIEVSRCRDCGGIWLAKTEVAKIVAARKAQPKAGVKPATMPTGTRYGVGADLAEGMADVAPLVIVETGSEIGAALGDFFVSFLG